MTLLLCKKADDGSTENGKIKLHYTTNTNESAQCFERIFDECPNPVKLCITQFLFTNNGISNYAVSAVIQPGICIFLHPTLQLLVGTIVMVVERKTESEMLMNICICMLLCNF